jgi:hypothetical protein
MPLANICNVRAAALLVPRVSGILGMGQDVSYVCSMADEALVDLNRERFNRIDSKLDRILGAIEQLTLRVGSLEQKTAIIVTDIARIDSRLDEFDRRLARIEKRLELVEA